MTDDEYHKVLHELGLLDDEEDWELYQDQETRYEYDYDYAHEPREVRDSDTN